MNGEGNLELETSWLKNAAASFRRQFSLHLPIYIIVGFSLAVASLVGMKVGLALDFSGVLGTLKTMGVLVACLSMGFLIYMFAGLVRQKSQSPTSDLIKAVKTRFENPEKLTRIFHMLILFSLASVAFAVLKSSIALLNPFSWDIAFRDWDKALHFGRLPHEWLGAITGSPFVILALNFAYNLWFFIIFLYLYIFASRYGTTKEGLQFYNAFFSSWIVIGFLTATYFSSAGPCYFDRLGLGGDYNGLMAQLHQANENYSIWALTTQDMLWDGQEGIREGRLGISAFPSMHVAMATIMALASSSVSRRWGIIAWIYAAIIMLGSVVLGWHYAVDGYASFGLVLGLWWISGKLANWTMARNSVATT